MPEKSVMSLPTRPSAGRQNMLRKCGSLPPSPSSLLTTCSLAAATPGSAETLNHLWSSAVVVFF